MPERFQRGKRGSDEQNEADFASSLERRQRGGGNRVYSEKLNGVIERAVERGDWEEVTALKEANSDQEEMLNRAEERFLIEELKRLKEVRFTSVTYDWLEKVVRHRTALLGKILLQKKGLSDFYRTNEAFLKIIVHRAVGLLLRPARALSESEEIDHADPDQEDVFLRTHVPCLSWIDWQTPAIQQLTVEPVCRLIGTEDLIEESRREEIIRFEQRTGYSLTGEFYLTERVKKVYVSPWGEGSDISDFTEWMEDWKKLHGLLGREYDQNMVERRVTDKLNELCVTDSSAKRIRSLCKSFNLRPSTQALRGRILYQIRVYKTIKDGVELAREYGVVPELTAEELQSVQAESPRAEAIIYSSLLPKKGKARGEMEHIFRARSSLAEFIPDLLAIQSPSKRSEFCPYEQVLPYLFKNERVFDLSSERVRKGLLTFFKRFGMHNLPYLAAGVIELVDQSRQGEALISTENPILEPLNRFLDIPPSELSLEDYFIRIEAAMEKMKMALLEDRPLDSRIERSAFGMELFNAVVPHVGSYQDVEDRPNLIAESWYHSEKNTLDPLYAPATFSIQVLTEQPKKEETDESTPEERAIRTYREFIFKKLEDETMQKLLQSWNKASIQTTLEPTGTVYAYWFSPLREAWQKEKEERLRQLTTVTKPEARTNIALKLERLNESLEKIDRLLQIHSKEDSYKNDTRELLEDLQSLFKNASGKVDRVKLEAEAGEIARALCVILMKDHSPKHYEEVETWQMEEASLNPRLTGAWERWFREEYLEHFAGLKTEAQVPLSPSLRALFQKLWRIDGLQEAIQAQRITSSTAPIGHPIIDVFSAIGAAEKEIEKLEQEGFVHETREMTIWPVKALGRVLAGDIANACFHRHRLDLARGKYPQLTALLMTLPSHSEIIGSTLLIEAKTESGKRVLVIRALNPTESVIHEVNAESVVEAMIAYVTKLAEKQGEGDGELIEEIRLCMDACGGHSTNRQAIADAEHALWTEHAYALPEEALVSTEETNFNTYPIWQREQTRIVWSRPKK